MQQKLRSRFPQQTALLFCGAFVIAMMALPRPGSAAVHSHIELGFYTLYYPSSFKATRYDHPEKGMILSLYQHESGEMMTVYSIKSVLAPAQEFQRVATIYHNSLAKTTGRKVTVSRWYVFSHANVFLLMFGPDKFGREEWVWIVPTYGGHLVISGTTQVGSPVLNLLHGFQFYSPFIGQPISANLPSHFPQKSVTDPSAAPKREEGLSFYFCRCLLSQPKSYAREGTYFVCARSAADAAGFSGSKCFPVHQTSCYACTCRGGARCLYRGK